MIQMFHRTLKSISSGLFKNPNFSADFSRQIYTRSTLPRDKLSWTMSRSSGPGGQNVNKLNTKVDMRFDLSEAQDWLPLPVVQRLKALFPNRINKRNEWVVTSDRFRTQAANFDDCLDKIVDAIREASHVPSGPSEETRERVQRHKSADKERRHQDKTKKSALKASRRKSGRWDD